MGSRCWLASSGMVLSRILLPTQLSSGNFLSNKSLRRNYVSCTIMIQGFCGKGLLEEACKLFMEMEANHCLPSDVKCTTLISGCFENQKYDEGCVLIEDTVDGFSADASTASILLELRDSKGQDLALLAFAKEVFASCTSRRGFSKGTSFF